MNILGKGVTAITKHCVVQKHIETCSLLNPFYQNLIDSLLGEDLPKKWRNDQ